MKKSEAAEIVMMLMSAFPNGKATESTSRVYESMLVDLDATLVRSAVTRLLATSRFLPSIAEIREAATAQQLGPCARGEEAYAALLMAKRRHGYDYGSIDARRRLRDPLFAEPHIAQCLTMWGGWNAFAMAGDDAPDRARFIAMYDQLAQRERHDVVSGQPLPVTSLEQARNNRAPLALVSSKGAAASALVAASEAPEAVKPAAAPVALITPPRPPPAPPREHRRWSAEELDVELARLGGQR